MKQIEFKTNKGEFVIAEINYPKITYQLEDWKEGGTICISGLHNGLLSLICGIQDITEEHAREVVDFCITGLGYDDYNGSICFGLRLTAIESLYSLLEANGVVFDNHLEKPSIYESWLEDDETIFDGSGNARKCVEYWESQSKVWNKQQTYLFKKI